MQLRAIALAIRDSHGEPFAAFSLCAIASRLKQPRTGEMVALMRDEIQAVEKVLAAKSDAGGKADLKREPGAQPPPRGFERP